MPLDDETLSFLVNEAIENGLQDCKENLNELSRKYRLKIIVRPPILVKVEQTEKGEVIWEKD